MILSLAHVEKRFGDLVALRDVSLALEPGRTGLLGPNGAGKSTLLKTLLGLVKPERGTVEVLGFDVARSPLEARAHVGYMPEGDAVLPELSALDYTALAGELSGLPRAEAFGRAHQVLHHVGLGEARYRPLHGFSTGMKQRARLAQALVGDPKLLLLDEPTSGLDPQGRDEMLGIIREIPERTGCSVILSTHILPDVESTCDKVVVLRSGEVLYAGDLAPLVKPEEGLLEVQTKGDDGPLRARLEAQGAHVDGAPSGLRVRLPPGQSADFVLRAALDAHVTVRHVAPLERSLEEAFVETVRSGRPHG